MCTKRYRYKCRGVALRAAEIVAIKLGRPTMRVYRCPDCRRWCLTRQRDAAFEGIPKENLDPEVP